MRTTSFKSRAFALVSTAALLATLVVASPANAAAAGPTCDGKTPVQTCTGTTSDGAAYKMVVPATFNGTVTIWSHGFNSNTYVPGTPTTPIDSSAQLAPNAPGETGGNAALIKYLTDQGVAVMGSGFSTQAWNLDEAVKNTAATEAERLEKEIELQLLKQGQEKAQKLLDEAAKVGVN
jgi:hypothetical protein